MAAAALAEREVQRIILTRPAVEAGERLGFLPGDIQAKVDPYLRPLFDALYDMLDPDRVNGYFERGVIEVAPLAFMRGRTLNDSFVILDEAQNTSPEQMKMFLTRLGFNSRMVVTGDITQIDLPSDQRSGLVVVRDILNEVQDISFVRFGGEDVVRHKLVQRIVAAYGEHAEREVDRRGGWRLTSPTCRPSCATPVAAALAAAGVDDGHLAVELVDAARIRELNREHRGKDAPTDVLAFPLDGAGPTAGPRELGDVAICPEHCSRRDRGRRPRRPPPLRLRPRDRRRRDARPAGPRAGGAAMTRAGFVGLAGRPNVGKSTLVNAIVGSRVAIVSMRPQTTRRAIRGIATDLEAGRQLVLVDLPGVQRPRDVLTERMQHRVERELADSDLALLVVNGEQGIGPGDRFIARALLGAGARACRRSARSTRSTGLGPNELVPVLAEAAELEGVDEVFPISARSGEGLEALVERLGELVPEGPYLYPPEDHSDQSSETMLAELIREQVLNRTRDEIPHSVEVQVKEVDPREDGLVTVRAEVWAETESQKGILIGKGGAKVGEIGTAARRSLEAELGAKVHLDLQVRVRRHWRRDEDCSTASASSERRLPAAGIRERSRHLRCR